MSLRVSPLPGPALFRETAFDEADRYWIFFRLCQMTWTTESKLAAARLAKLS